MPRTNHNNFKQPPEMELLPHYIGKDGKSYLLLIENCKMQMHDGWQELVVYKDAVNDPTAMAMAMRVREFKENHTKVPDHIVGKWIKCLKNPAGELVNSTLQYMVGEFYQIILSSLANERPIIHTKFGQGTLLYAPGISEYFDIFNPVKTKTGSGEQDDVKIPHFPTFPFLNGKDAAELYNILYHTPSERHKTENMMAGYFPSDGGYMCFDNREGQFYLGSFSNEATCIMYLNGEEL